eukprot:PITA_26672
MERARSMINNINLQKELWAEEISTACYLVNRSPSIVINCKIPEEVWLGKSCDYSHLRIFGCDAYALIPKNQCSKLDPKEKCYVFVGYDYAVPNQQIQLEAKPFSESQKEGETSEGKGEEDANETVEVPEPVQQPVTLRRSTRERKTSKKYEDYASSIALITKDGEPSYYQEVVNDANNKKWKWVMDKEMDSLAKKKTWDIVELPEGRSVVVCKWIFKLKRNIDGSIERYKATHHLKEKEKEQ